MYDIAQWLASAGGVARAHEFTEAGFGPGVVRAAWESGRIHRPRKGWYTSPELPADVHRAVRVGGRLTCVSAALHAGLWVLHRENLHVEIAPHASRLRRPSSHRQRLAVAPDRDRVDTHWTSSEGGDRITVSREEVVSAAFSCRPPDEAFVVFESALRHGWFSTVERAVLLDRLPARVRRVAAEAGRSSDSGIESLVKLMLLRHGIRFRQQAFVPGVGPVDFLIGDCLVIETDGREFHADPYRDRRKDADLSILGYRTLRFLYAQVVFELEAVEAAVLAAILRGDHLR